MRLCVCSRLRSQKSRKLFGPENISGRFSGVFSGSEKCFLKHPKVSRIVSRVRVTGYDNVTWKAYFRTRDYYYNFQLFLLKAGTVDELVK